MPRRQISDVHSGKKQKESNGFLGIFGVPARTINLRRGIVIEGPVAFTLGCIVLLGGVFLIDRALTKAEVVDFFPATCLGTWQNPQLAQEEPETFNVALDVARPDETNAAAYAGGFEKIFCGGFVPGDYEAKGKLKEVGLTLVLRVDEGSDTGALPKESEAPAGGTGAWWLGNIAYAQEAAEEVASASSPSTEEVALVEEIVPQPSVTESTEPETTPPVEAQGGNASGQVIEISPPIGAVLEPLSSSTGEDMNAEEVQGTSTGELGSNSAGPEKAVPDDRFLKITYSFDGHTWFEAGKIAPESGSRITLTVPVASWGELRTLQIGVEGIESTLTTVPSAYLDGMFIEAKYEIAPLLTGDAEESVEGDPGIPIVEVDRKLVAADKGESAFGAGEGPVFDLNLEGIGEDAVPEENTVPQAQEAPASAPEEVLGVEDAENETITEANEGSGRDGAVSEAMAPAEEDSLPQSENEGAEAAISDTESEE